MLESLCERQFISAYEREIREFCYNTNAVIRPQKTIRQSHKFLPFIWLATAAAKSRNRRGNTTTYTTRHPKIMFGFPTRDGEFGWQASLELLHPSLGFIGHWCGGVLIHKYWVLSSAHCIHKWVITEYLQTTTIHQSSFQRLVQFAAASLVVGCVRWKQSQSRVRVRAADSGG